MGGKTFKLKPLVDQRDGWWDCQEMSCKATEKSFTEVMTYDRLVRDRPPIRVFERLVMEVA